MRYRLVLCASWPKVKVRNMHTYTKLQCYSTISKVNCNSQACQQTVKPWKSNRSKGGWGDGQIILKLQQAVAIIMVSLLFSCWVNQVIVFVLLCLWKRVETLDNINIIVRTLRVLITEIAKETSWFQVSNKITMYLYSRINWMCQLIKSHTYISDLHWDVVTHYLIT